mgnify:CR=1 FL=1
MSELWNPGNYVGNLVSGEFGKNDKGTPQCVLKFDIEGNQKIIFIYLSDGAREIAFEQLEQLGWNGSTSSPEFANGQGVDLYMKVERYEDKDREKWSISRGFKTEPMAQDEARRIEALWKQRGKPGATGSKPAASAPARTSTAAPSRTAPTGDAFGKNEAWDAFQKKGKSSGDFYAAVDGLLAEKKIEESAMTTADWRYVAGIAGTPF